MTELQHVVQPRHSPTPHPVIPEELRLPRLARRRYALALALALALAFGIRAWHVLSQDFPLNDGGLFYAMTRDLQAADYRLPAFTSYNQAGIPYGYSPLGFYLAGLLDDLTSLTLADAFRWLPLVSAWLIVAAFALLARSLLAQRAAVVAAVLAFAVVPRSFLWMLMGGGLTRSLGLLFALLTLYLLARFYAIRRWSLAVGAGLTGGLTLLGHLGTAPFLGFSAALFWLAWGRHRIGTLGSAAAAAVAALVSAPWWAQVLAVHGPEPFLAASATGGSIFRSIDLRHALITLSTFGLGTGESVLGLVAMLAVVGVVYSLATHEWLLPAWWIATMVLDARQGATFATLPISMLAGVAVIHVLLPAMRRASSWSGAPATLRRNPGRRGWSIAVTFGLLLLFGAGTALLRLPGLRGGLPDLAGLGPAEREAMTWVAQETPKSTRILVVGGTTWEIDRHSEWLPVLGRRRSVATVQGWEWRPRGEFARKKREYNDVQACAWWSTECLESWARATGVAFDYVYVPRRPGQECCAPLLLSLSRDPGYVRLYQGRGAAIFERRWSFASRAIRPQAGRTRP